MQNILDLLLDAVCVVNEEGVFLSASGAVARIFGYTVDEMTGRQMMDFIHPDDKTATKHAVARLMNGYEQYDFQNRYIRKDGTTVYLMWTARWYPERGIRVAVARDVTLLEQRRSANNTIPSLTVSAALTLKCWRLAGSPPQLTSPNGRTLGLSGQDYAVLKAIAVPRRVVSRREIIEAMGHNYLDYDQRRLDSQMRRLRRKVETVCGLTLPITTLRSVGYRFYDDVEFNEIG